MRMLVGTDVVRKFYTGIFRVFRIKYVLDQRKVFFLFSSTVTVTTMSTDG